MYVHISKENFSISCIVASLKSSLLEKDTEQLTNRRSIDCHVSRAISHQVPNRGKKRFQQPTNPVIYATPTVQRPDWSTSETRRFSGYEITVIVYPEIKDEKVHIDLHDKVMKCVWAFRIPTFIQVDCRAFLRVRLNLYWGKCIVSAFFFFWKNM